MTKTEEILERCNRPGAQTGPTSAELREILHESHVEGAPTVHVLTENE